MDFFATGEFDESKLDGTTLVMPAISIGNVGQLAVDLLVEALRPVRVGFLEDPHVLPCVGNDPYGQLPSGALTTALEVYQDAHKGLTVMQQRAPVAQGKLEAFAEDLGAWVVAAGFREVVILTGANAGKRKHAQMHGDQMRYISSAKSDSPSTPGSDPRCQQLGWTPLEGLEEGFRELESTLAERSLDAPNGANGMAVVRDESHRLREEEVEEDEEGHPGPLEGGEWGVDQEAYVWKSPFWRLFRELKGHGVRVLVLLLFCNEGDNVPDALTMADRADGLLHLLPQGEPERGAPRWSTPLSWAHLFGPPPDTSLFG